MSDGIKQAVIESLKQIKGPDLEGNIVSLGLVSDVFVSDGKFQDLIWGVTGVLSPRR